MTGSPIAKRVLAIGLGNMGQSHALAYHQNPGFEIVELVNCSRVDLPEQLRGYRYFDDYIATLKKLNFKIQERDSGITTTKRHS